MKAATYGIEVFQQLLLRETPGAIESHVLAKMSQTTLILIFLNTARAHE
ncbi:MAG: hypothetical protein RBS43_11500 [Candidatus Cloacimonas sp.]|jgi:hypothetical protein|nr:hypothetical protein [Candidatus Cloacimonas sp.]